MSIDIKYLPFNYFEKQPHCYSHKVIWRDKYDILYKSHENLCKDLINPLFNLMTFSLHNRYTIPSYLSCTVTIHSNLD